MTRVLVITDSERVQRVFESLETNGALQLTSAGTLSEGDEEILAAVPDSVFLQSRISGFSGEIVIRHLKKTLPATTKVTLLAVDPEDAAQAKKHKIPVVELWADDEGLKDQVHAAVTAGGRKKGTKGRVADRRKTQREPSPTPAAEGVPAEVTGAAAEEQAAVSPGPQAAAEAPAPSVDEKPAAAKAPAPSAVEKPAAAKKRARKPPVPEELFTEATEAPVEERLEADETEPAEPEVTSFAELMRRAAAKRAPATAAEVEDRVQVGGAPQAAPAERPKSPAAAQPETPHAPAFVPAEPTPEKPEKREQPAPKFVLAEEQEKVPPAGFYLAEEPEKQEMPTAEEFVRGEPLAEAMLRTKKQKRPYWIFPLAVALLLVPLVYYSTKGGEQRPQPPPAKGAQQSPGAQPQGPPAATAPAPARVQPPARIPTTPAAPLPAGKGPAPAGTRQAPAAVQPRAQAPAPAAPAAPPKGAAPATLPPAPPATRQAAPQGARPPKPAPVQKGGLKTLPPFLAGATVDPAYGKSHPGWVRYLAPRAQYRLFRQGDTYKALQVMPLGGGTIPDQLYQRALLEFGGIDSYQLQSSDVKGSYLIEQGVAKGGVGVTIYRNRSDLGIKGLVIYYR